MTTDWPEDMSEEDRINLERWTVLATAIGYNELAKKTETIEERSFWRLSRDSAAMRFKELGGQGTLFAVEDAVVEIEVPGPMPSIKFRESDIEMLRKFVSRHSGTNEQRQASRIKTLERTNRNQAAELRKLDALMIERKRQLDLLGIAWGTRGAESKADALTDAEVDQLDHMIQRIKLKHRNTKAK